MLDRYIDGKDTIHPSKRVIVPVSRLIALKAIVSAQSAVANDLSKHLNSPGNEGLGSE
jgi:hypothetical protein